MTTHNDNAKDKNSNPNPIPAGSDWVDHVTDGDLDKAAAAFRVVEPKLRAFDARRVRAPYMAAQVMAARVLARADELLSLTGTPSDDGVVTLTREDVNACSTLAFALLHLATQVDRCRVRNASRAGVAVKAVELRDRLARWTTVLVADGVIPEHEVQNARRGISHHDIAHDVRLYASVLDAHWGRISGHTSLTREDLVQAAAAGNALAVAAEETPQDDPETVALVGLRDVAATMLDDAWSTVRRRVTYLRWNDGDAHVFAPSLKAGDTGRTRREDSGSEPGVPAPVPTPTPVTAGGVSTPKDAQDGGPGGSPFDG